MIEPKNIECYCSQKFDAPSCKQSNIRPKKHKKSGCAGVKNSEVEVSVKSLVESGQVLSIAFTRSNINDDWDLSFETIPNVCANQLCHYLIFEEG